MNTAGLKRKREEKLMEPEGFTMKEVENRLGIKQNILIYLCEKDVVVPDVENPPKGRGHVRRFSEFNIFEFAVALEIKKYNIKISYIAIIMSILKQVFQSPDFYNFKKFKEDQSLPSLILGIVNGEKIYFQFHSEGHSDDDKFMPAINLNKLSPSAIALLAFEVMKPEDNEYNFYRTKLEINLNKISWSV